MGGIQAPRDKREEEIETVRDSRQTDTRREKGRQEETTRRDKGYYNETKREAISSASATLPRVENEVEKMRFEKKERGHKWRLANFDTAQRSHLVRHDVRQTQ